MKTVQIIGLILISASSIGILLFIGWLMNEVAQLRKEVKRLRRLFTKVCKNWSADAEDVKREILEMVADHENEKAELEQRIKNLEHARKQLAKGEKSR